jgi:hypothetical protein
MHPRSSPRFQQTYDALSMMMKKKKFKAWLSERIKSCTTDGVGAVALGGGPGAELCALRRFLWDFLVAQPRLGDPADLVFDGTVVDASDQWRTAVKRQGYGFVQMEYAAVIEAHDGGGSGARKTKSRYAKAAQIGVLGPCR